MNKEEIMEKLQDIFRDVFADDEIVLEESTSADDIDEWDSLMQITLIAEVQKAFQVSFKLKDVRNLENAGELADLVLKELSLQ